MTEINGNNQTKLMHLVTLHELQKMHVRNTAPLQKIVPEQGVLLERNHGNCERCGRFDFLVFAQDGKTIGFEVLSRPSQGKLKEKLAYAKEVDEFVFVLPSNSMELFRKKKQKPFKALARKKFLDKALSEKCIKVWLIDTKQGIVTEKGKFGELFNVKR